MGFIERIFIENWYNLQTIFEQNPPRQTVSWAGFVVHSSTVITELSVKFASTNSEFSSALAHFGRSATHEAGFVFKVQLFGLI